MTPQEIQLPANAILVKQSPDGKYQEYKIPRLTPKRLDGIVVVLDGKVVSGNPAS